MNQGTTLTPRQARFVDEFIISGNAAAAARAAGYSPNGAKVTASRMLTNTNLRAALAAKRQAGAEKFELDRKHVIAAIMQAIAIAKAHGKPGVMISGWCQVGRMLGFYDPASIKADRQRQTESGTDDLRFVPTADLLNGMSKQGQFRNPDGSAMTPAQIDGFYRGLSDGELKALAEGRARVVMKVELGEPTCCTGD